MPLTAGQKLGPYEIVEPLGSGGMGEVYKARDTRLGRTVAIKVSTKRFSERFEREARSVAALNHPNICTLHDVGPDFLVMEYIEGAPIKGPLPPETVVRCAAQIASALEAAHRKGIIHRDLKPANVLATRSGVKLLDFGLAKQAPQANAKPADTTLTKPLTSEGTILGTLPYMAPEQLEGKEADARTDIFAFGAVLYEMATGKRAFSGSSQASLISAIMTATPQPVSRLEPTSPPELDRIVRRCLEKNPDNRYQSARDLELDLEASLVERPQHSAPAKRGVPVQWFIAAVAAVACAAGWLWLGRAATPPPQTVRFSLHAPDGYRLVDEGSGYLSPDGRTALLYAVKAEGGAPTLWLRPLGAEKPKQVPDSERASHAFWSPDGKSIAFFAGGKLKRADAAGGEVQVLCDAEGEEGGTWSQEGVIVFASRGELYRISASGGRPSMIERKDDPAGTAQDPQFLPDGVTFLYGHSRRGAAGLTARLRSLHDAAGRTLRGINSRFRYGAGYLFYEDDGISARPFDTNGLALEGEAALLTRSGSLPSISTGGAIAYMSGADVYDCELVIFNRALQRLAVFQPPGAGAYAHVEFSPDNRQIAAAYGQHGSSDVWTIDTERGVPSRTTSDMAEEGPAAWSADGTRIFIVRPGGGDPGIYEMPVAGAGDPQLVWPGAAHRMHASPDGRFLAFEAVASKENHDIYVLPLQGERKPAPFAASEFSETDPQFSPDGRWIAYGSDESGRIEVYIQSWPPGRSPKLRVSRDGGSQPRWRRDGRELYFDDRGGTRHIMGVDVRTEGKGVTAGVPRPIFHAPRTGSAVGRFDYFAASADGQRFLLNVPKNASMTDRSLTVVLNWRPPAGEDVK